MSKKALELSFDRYDETDLISVLKFASSFLSSKSKAIAILTIDEEPKHEINVFLMKLWNELAELSVLVSWEEVESWLKITLSKIDENIPLSTLTKHTIWDVLNELECLSGKTKTKDILLGVCSQKGVTNLFDFVHSFSEDSFKGIKWIGKSTRVWICTDMRDFIDEQYTEWQWDIIMKKFRPNPKWF